MELSPASSFIHSARIRAEKSKNPHLDSAEINRLVNAGIELQLLSAIGGNQFSSTTRDLANLWIELNFKTHADYLLSFENNFVTFRHPNTGVLLKPWLKLDAAEEAMSRL